MWLPSKEARVEPGPLDQYRWAVRRHITPLIGAVRMRDLTPEVVDAWVRDLTAKDANAKPRLGATSARLVRKVLSMALQEAVERGRLPRNPVVLSQPPRRDRKLGWTLEEAGQFLSVISGHRLYAAFDLSLGTGLRRGEVLGLRWQDLNVDDCWLQVVQQLSTEGGRPVIKSLKTEASERVVTFARPRRKSLLPTATRSSPRPTSSARRGPTPAWSSRPQSEGGSTPTVVRHDDGTTVSPLTWDRGPGPSASASMMMTRAGAVGQVGPRRRVTGWPSPASSPTVGFCRRR